jgi:hypothetical protein
MAKGLNFIVVKVKLNSTTPQLTKPSLRKASLAYGVDRHVKHFVAPLTTALCDHRAVLDDLVLWSMVQSSVDRTKNIIP